MIKVTNLAEKLNQHPKRLLLQMHISEKSMNAMMQEYQVENLDDIGCFVVLESEEFTRLFQSVKWNS